MNHITILKERLEKSFKEVRKNILSLYIKELLYCLKNLIKEKEKNG